MRFFHYSTSPYSILLPQKGQQHLSKSPTQGKPVVWLFNKKLPRGAFEKLETICKYQHEVEVPEDDLHLHLDKEDAEFMAQAGESLRSYFLTRPVPVLEILEWDVEVENYEVPVSIPAIENPNNAYLINYIEQAEEFYEKGEHAEARTALAIVKFALGQRE